jgi:hypothetical protein
MKAIDFFNQFIKDKEFVQKKQSSVFKNKYPNTAVIFEWKQKSDYVRFRILNNGDVEAGAFKDFTKLSTRTFKLNCKTSYESFFKSYAYPFVGI